MSVIVKHHASAKRLFLDSFGVTGKCSVFMLTFGQTDGQTERQTPVKQYPPIFWRTGQKKKKSCACETLLPPFF